MRGRPFSALVLGPERRHLSGVTTARQVGFEAPGLDGEIGLEESALSTDIHNGLGLGLPSSRPLKRF